MDNLREVWEKMIKKIKLLIDFHSYRLLFFTLIEFCFQMAVMVNGNVALYGATKVYGDVTVSALTGTNIAIAEWNKKAIEGMEQKN